MGILERKEKQKTELRHLILEASMELFVQEGFEKVSIRKIAEKIEYSPTTIYLYFKDKNEILYQLNMIGFGIMAEYNKDLPAIKNPLLRLHKMGENYIRFGMENPHYYDLMFIQQAPMDALEKLACDDWEAGDQAFDALCQVIRDCMDAGLIIKGDVIAAALAIWGMVHGLVALNVRQRLGKMLKDGRSVEESMNQALTFFLNAIDHTLVKA